MELRDLREALQVTQVTLAKKLKTTQAAVSRLEKRPHMLVNTLRDYVEALGGRIEVHAVLPGRTVSLTHFLGKKKPTAMGTGKGVTAQRARRKALETRRTPSDPSNKPRGWVPAVQIPSKRGAPGSARG